MNICHIVGHGDQRAIKECIALRDKGHYITFMTKAVNSYMQYYNESRIFGSDELLPQAIQTTNCDIYHIHCKPASIPKLAIETLRKMGKPYIYDVHDLDIVRFGKTCSEELYALLNSPYLLFPDGAIEQKTTDLVFQHLNKKPNTMSLLPYFSRTADMIYPMISPNPMAVKERIKHIVYEGNIVLPSIENIKAFPYYDLRFIALTFTTWGYVFHIYPVGIDFNSCKTHYEMTGATLHQPLEYPSLIRDMSQWGWGFFGCFVPDTQANNTFANKIFDYICAGIPVIVMNAQRMGQFLTETGFGLEIKGFDDIQRIKDDPAIWEEIQTKILSERSAWSMEEKIGPLIEFYKQAVDDPVFNRDVIAQEEVQEIELPVDDIGMVFSDNGEEEERLDFNAVNKALTENPVIQEPIQIHSVTQGDSKNE